MKRYFLSIAYKGAGYHGWQIQPETPTVQQCLQKAFQQLGYGVKVVGSSRTDARVNAYRQVAHVDLPVETDVKKLLGQLNAVLPLDVAINQILPVEKDTHARYHAISRTYHYYVMGCRDPFKVDTAYFFPRKIDVPLMNQAAELLLGKQNFKSFCKSKSAVGHHFCTVTQALWVVEERGTVFTITANRFLHGMVRTIVGTLLEVGQHKLSIEDFRQIILGQNRCLARRSLPAHALFLTRVDYPPLIGKDLPHCVKDYKALR